tara:strand:- start:501 stop:707 length:207 start_codon:yes stop_codon:yes gene_type:complete
VKNYFIIISFFCLFSCSFDNQSGVWNDKINDIELSKINLSDLNNDKSFEEYKRIIIIYGKHSEFPDIN